jgi:hypothetical protein
MSTHGPLDVRDPPVILSVEITLCLARESLDPYMTTISILSDAPML